MSNAYSQLHFRLPAARIPLGRENKSEREINREKVSRRKREKRERDEKKERERERVTK